MQNIKRGFMSHLSVQNTSRISSIDALRGFAMVFMALDHVRGFFTNQMFEPTDLNHTSLVLFSTRFITHFCAPIFILLVGTSMFLAISKGKTVKEISFFLLTRGLWMIVAELTLIHFAWTFNLDFRVQDLQVISAIGCSMIVLSGLVYLPSWLILMIGLTLIVGHNFLDGHDQLLGIFSVLHLPAKTTIQQVTIYWDYPIIPWIGVPAVGYVLGRLFLMDTTSRTRWLTVIGSICCIAFLILRATNVYGDLTPWTTQHNTVYTIMSFLNCNKYPPSLLYLLMTLGPALLLLAYLQNKKNILIDVLSIFGKVPFFFYVLHLLLIHFAVIVVGLLLHKPIHQYFSNTIILWYTEFLAPYGYDLWVTYLVWILTLVVLFPLCYKYAQFKNKHKNNTLLSYI